jgi:hypothetical protein
MAYDIEGIEHQKLVKILDSFNRRLAADLSERLDGTAENGDRIHIGPDTIQAALDAFVAEETVSYDFMAEDIASAVNERADEAEGRAEEAEEKAEALRENPELTALEYGPDILRWDERERAFICSITGTRFRLAREAD